MRSSTVIRLLPYLVLTTLLVLNLVEWPHGSIAFENFQGEPFSRPRGFPFSFVAGANDEGATLVDACVVKGGTRINRNTSAGPYPHLAWNPGFLYANLVVAAVLFGIALWVSFKMRPTAQQVACSGPE